MSNSTDTPVVEKKKDQIIDLDGVITQFPIRGNKKFIFAMVAAALVFVLVGFCTDLSAYSPMASKALGGFLALIIIMMFSDMNLAVNFFCVGLFGLLLGIWEWKDVTAALGSSSFHQTLGLLIVALGCEYTPLGKRLAYSFLSFLGQKPKTMIIAFTAACMIFSAFVANAATVILMASIGNQMLEAMGEKRGESVIGKTMMGLIMAGAMIGGGMLIGGAPIGNTNMITLLSTASEGRYTVEFSQWGVLGCITGFLSIVPVVLVYCKINGVKNSGYKLLPKSYYQEHLKELGRIGGSELRWIIIAGAMIVAMAVGVPGGKAAIIAGFVCCLPGIGVVPQNEMVKKVPLNSLICVCFVGLMAFYITKTGLAQWFCDVLSPVFGLIKSPVVFSILCAVLMAVGVSTSVNGIVAIQAALFPVMVVVAERMGFNPSVVLQATMFSASYFWVMGPQSTNVLCRGFGWWEDRDLLAPGYATICIAAAID